MEAQIISTDARSITLALQPGQNVADLGAVMAE